LRLLKWLVRWLETTPAPLLMRARSLTALYELDGPDTNGGEWRRSQVYGRLQHEFPRVTKRAISRAIEDAL
jgi:hypothetical protein